MRVETLLFPQIYEISLNVSMGSVGASEVYDQLRLDTTSVRVQVRACWSFLLEIGAGSKCTKLFAQA